MIKNVSFFSVRVKYHDNIGITMFFQYGAALSFNPNYTFNCTAICECFTF